MMTTCFKWVPLLALAACATTPPQPATTYDWVARETHSRILFNSRQNWHKRDYHVVPAGQEDWGNCATFAATAVDIMSKKGIPTAVGECNSDAYGHHAFALILGTSLVVDSMHRTAVPFSTMECNRSK